MAEYYDKQRKALEDDLRMFQEAERDNTDVEGSGEELPVIRSKAYKPDSYGKYWDRENAALAYPEDEQDMAKARWDAEHWDEEHGEPELISAGAARLREKPLGGSPMEYMDNAVMFPSAAKEHAFWMKMLGNDEAAARKIENLSKRYRDATSDALLDAKSKGAKVSNIDESSKQVAVWGNTKDGTTEANFGSAKMNPKHGQDAAHEAAHLTENQFGGNTQRYNELMEKNQFVTDLRSRYIEGLQNGTIGNKTNDLYAFVKNELSKQPHWNTLTQDEKFQVYAGISDWISNSRDVATGVRANDIAAGAHPRGYAKLHENKSIPWDAAGGEGVANAAAQYSMEGSGRMAHQLGLPDENAFYSTVQHSTPSSFNVKTLKADKGEGNLGYDEFSPKIKLGGSKYEKWIDENADLIPNRSGTPFDSRISERATEEQPFFAKMDEDMVGDRYGGIYKKKNGNVEDFGYNLASWTKEDALNKRMPNYSSEVKPKLVGLYDQRNFLAGLSREDLRANTGAKMFKNGQTHERLGDELKTYLHLKEARLGRKLTDEERRKAVDSWYFNNSSMVSKARGGEGTIYENRRLNSIDSLDRYAGRYYAKELAKGRNK